MVFLMSSRRVFFAQAFVTAPSRFARTTTPAAPVVAARFLSSQSPRTTTSCRSAVSKAVDAISSTTTTTNRQDDAKLLNLSTVTKEDLHTILVDGWGYPKFRVKQVWNWIREQGITDVDQMTNLPAKLREQLSQFAVQSALTLLEEQVSNDGTIKRAYQCADGQVIESVLMPYSDGRYTACISSQAGCAQGCVFCATGQMGFSRQLTSEEIFEQVARFAAELKQQSKRQSKEDAFAAPAAEDDDDDDDENHEDENNRRGGRKQHGRTKRLSNVVFMGMGEPLANYRNVVTAINRLTGELGIGARKITVSTVGIVPNIRKMTHDKNVPQIRLAVSLHCANDEERSALLPANRRFGGLDELMDSLKDYIDTTGRRITLEWALIEGQNDGVETARQLGKLIVRSGLRRDMVHVNVIPLNPTGGFTGGPSGRGRVNAFTEALEKDYGITCTPRVRRGIDIDAGCGQLTSSIKAKQQRQIGNDIDNSNDSDGDVNANEPFAVIDVKPPAIAIRMEAPRVGVYEDEDDEDEDIVLRNYDDDDEVFAEAVLLNDEFLFDESLTVDFESDNYEDPVFDQDSQKQEASRLIGLVKGMTIATSTDSSSMATKTVKTATPKKQEAAVATSKDSSSSSMATKTTKSTKTTKAATPQKREASRLIGLVKGMTVATSTDSSSSSSAATKTATPSVDNRP
jgi:23S rRNA (adenine2503-C2)-methyltransferase